MIISLLLVDLIIVSSFTLLSNLTLSAFKSLGIRHGLILIFPADVIQNAEWRTLRGMCIQANNITFIFILDITLHHNNYDNHSPYSLDNSITHSLVLVDVAK